MFFVHLHDVSHHINTSAFFVCAFAHHFPLSLSLSHLQMIIVTSNKQSVIILFCCIFLCVSICFHEILNETNVTAEKNQLIPFFMLNDLLRW